MKHDPEALLRQLSTDTAPPELKARIRGEIAGNTPATTHQKRASFSMLALFALAACALVAVLVLQFTGNDTAQRTPAFVAEDEPAHTPAAEPAVDSPMFRGNAQRTGYYPGALGSLKRGKQNQKIVFANSIGTLYAFDAASGAELWNQMIGIEAYATPTIVSAVIYVASDNSLHALDAETCQTVWEFKIGDDPNDSIVASPAVADGVVYISSSKGLYALHAETGRELWKARTAVSGYSSPAIVDSTVYVGAYDHIHAFSTESGKELWSAQAGRTAISSPVVVDAVLYVGSEDGHLYAFDAKTGQELWRFQTGDWIHSSPAVAGGVVFVGSYDNHLYAVDAQSGRELWRAKTGDAVYSSPAVCDGAVYVGSKDHCVYAFDAGTGRELWRAQTGNWVQSSPAVAGGILYIGSKDKQVYALDAKTGTELWRAQVDDWVFASPIVADFAEPGAQQPRKKPAHMTADDPDTTPAGPFDNAAWKSAPVSGEAVVFDISSDLKYALIGGDNNSWAVIHLADGSATNRSFPTWDTTFQAGLFFGEHNRVLLASGTMAVVWNGLHPKPQGIASSVEFETEDVFSNWIKTLRVGYDGKSIILGGTAKLMFAGEKPDSGVGRFQLQFNEETETLSQGDIDLSSVSDIEDKFVESMQRGQMAMSVFPGGNIGRVYLCNGQLIGFYFEKDHSPGGIGSETSYCDLGNYLNDDFTQLSASADLLSLAIASDSGQAKRLTVTLDKERGYKIESSESLPQCGFKAISTIAMSPDGAWLAAADEDKILRVWNLKTMSLSQQTKLAGEAVSLRFAPDNSFLLVSFKNGEVLRLSEAK